MMNNFFESDCPANWQLFNNVLKVKVQNLVQIDMHCFSLPKRNLHCIKQIVWHMAQVVSENTQILACGECCKTKYLGLSSGC